MNRGAQGRRMHRLWERLVLAGRKPPYLCRLEARLRGQTDVGVSKS